MHLLQSDPNLSHLLVGPQHARDLRIPLDLHGQDSLRHRIAICAYGDPDHVSTADSAPSNLSRSRDLLDRRLDRLPERLCYCLSSKQALIIARVLFFVQFPEMLCDEGHHDGELKLFVGLAEPLRDLLV